MARANPKKLWLGTGDGGLGDVVKLCRSYDVTTYRSMDMDSGRNYQGVAGGH